jgi:hypothetical protein
MDISDNFIPSTPQYATARIRDEAEIDFTKAKLCYRMVARWKPEMHASKF